MDSNCDPFGIDFVVPGNDDSLRAIQLYCASVANACLEGAALFNERVQTEVAEEEKTRAAGAQPEKTATGRVVVEIKQQPRRGRGSHSIGGRRDGSEAEAKPDATPPVATVAAPVANTAAPASDAAPTNDAPPASDAAPTNDAPPANEVPPASE